MGCYNLAFLFLIKKREPVLTIKKPLLARGCYQRSPSPPCSFSFSSEASPPFPSLPIPCRERRGWEQLAFLFYNVKKRARARDGL
jgi:hypothetical protein